jgi:hypothetical protein
MRLACDLLKNLLYFQCKESGELFRQKTGAIFSFGMSILRPIAGNRGLDTFTFRASD